MTALIYDVFIPNPCTLPSRLTDHRQLEGGEESTPKIVSVLFVFIVEKWSQGQRGGFCDSIMRDLGLRLRKRYTKTSMCLRAHWIRKKTIRYAWIDLFARRSMLANQTKGRHLFLFALSSVERTHHHGVLGPSIDLSEIRFS